MAEGGHFREWVFGSKLQSGIEATSPERKENHADTAEAAASAGRPAPV
jgi:hypothetical protein